jgi:hypothetical protein
MAQQFANNARALLVAGISDTDTSIVIEAAKADLFPVANVGTGSLPSASSWFKVTLQNSAGAVEIVAVRTRTAGSGVLSNVIRGYDDTTPLNFVAGTVVGLRITAEDVQGALDLPNANNTFTGNNTFSGNNTLSGNNTFSGDNEFTTIPESPTPTAGSTDLQMVNAAFVANAIATAVAATKQALYPVGSIYTNSSVTTNPATLLGFGTWVAFGAGRVPVGLNAGDSLFDTLEETGGSKDATLVSHTHTATSTVTDPGHTHNINYGTSGSSSTPMVNGEGDNNVLVGTKPTLSATTGVTVATSISTTGSSGTNANLQPYITVAMWKRTA